MAIVSDLYRCLRYSISNTISCLFSSYNKILPRRRWRRPQQAENTNKGRSSVRYGQPQHQGVPILGEVGRGTPKGDNPTGNVNVNLAMTQMTDAMVSMASQETASAAVHNVNDSIKMIVGLKKEAQQDGDMQMAEMYTAQLTKLFAKQCQSLGL